MLNKGKRCYNDIQFRNILFLFRKGCLNLHSVSVQNEYVLFFLFTPVNVPLYLDDSTFKEGL